MDELESLRKARRILADARRKNPGLNETLSQIDEILQKLEEQIGQARFPARPRKGAGTTYSIMEEGGRSYLAELRQTARPLKASKELYNILISVLTPAERPLPFDELAALVNGKSEGNPAEWQIRMVLRFLLRAQPPILERERNRYRILNMKHARKHAEDWWQKAEVP